MHFRQTLTALIGLVSSVVGAPAPIGHTTTSRGGLNNTTNDEKRSLLDSVLSPLENNNIILPGTGLNILIGSAISQVARIAELEFAALVASQFALAIQLEKIKANIRINHFRAQFPQVNCVIMCVTNVLDQRDPNNINNRYLLNQLRIDNGFPDKELLIMVTDSQQMTIVPTPTAAADFSQNPINSIIPDLSPLLSNITNKTDTATFTDTVSSPATDTFTESESTLFPQAKPTSSLLNNASSTAQPTPSPISPSSDPTQPAGATSLNLGSLIQPTASPSVRSTRNHSQKGNSRRQINLIDLPALTGSSLPDLGNLNLLNQSLLLPFGTAAPTFGSSLGLVLGDPASIILPNQQNVFVDTLDSLQTNCLALQLGLGTAGGLLLSGNAGLGLGGFQGQVFGSLEAALAAQLAGLNLNDLLLGESLGQPIIPPGIIAANPDLADDEGVDVVTTVTGESSLGGAETATLTEELSTTETGGATVTDEVMASETGRATETEGASVTGTEGESTETVSARAGATRRRRY